MPQQHPAHRHASPRPVLKWLGAVAAGTLLLGTAPAAGVQPAGPQATPASAAVTGTILPVVQPVYALPPEDSPLLDRPSDTLWAAEWTPGYQPDISSEVGPDGSARNGEGVSGSGGALHVATGPAGLLPGGLALAAPVASTRITSGFGWRLNPTGPGSYIHIGQDYGVPCGTPVRAAEDGTVVQSAWAGHSGQRIRVDHGGGVETAYSHNSLLVVHVGDTVRQGDLLALSGTTGNSTGCHVHFEVYRDGKWVDPARYLPALPGQDRPVTDLEREQITRSRALPAGQATAAPRPSPSTTNAHKGGQSTPTKTAAVADEATAGSTPTTHPRDDARQPQPAATPKPPRTSPSAPTTAPAADPTPPASPKPPPSTPPAKQPPASPTTTPSPSPTATGAPAPTPSPTPTATPAPPTGSPTTPPSSSPAPTPTPTPDPAPSPDPTPTEPPAPPTAAPPTLASLCLAYQAEHQDRIDGPRRRDNRQLADAETLLLGDALAATVPTAKPLPDGPTVTQVAALCPVWFPDGIAQDTVPADLEALLKAAATAARQTGGTTK